MNFANFSDAQDAGGHGELCGVKTSTLNDAWQYQKHQKKEAKKIKLVSTSEKTFWSLFRAVHSGERGCYRSNRKNYRIDRIELRKKNVFGRLFFFVGRSGGTEPFFSFQKICP